MNAPVRPTDGRAAEAEAPERLEDHVGYALRLAQIAVFQDFHRVMEGLGLTPTQYSILMWLHAHPGARASQVAETLRIKRTNFVPLLDRLETRGLVERHRLPEDRRAFALRLTAEGERLRREANRRVARSEGRIARALGPAGKQALLDLLARVRQSAEAPPPQEAGSPPFAEDAPPSSAGSQITTRVKRPSSLSIRT